MNRRTRSFVKTAERTFQWYDNKKAFLAPLAFLTGFVLDNLGSRRIDLLTDNLQLLSYFLLTGVFIIAYHGSASGHGPAFIVKHRRWLPMLIQFCLGGLLSSHVYFYFQSSAGIKSILFLAVLFFVVLFNEFLKNRIRDLYLQFILFFLAGFSFFIFFLPVFTHEMSARMFLVGGLISLVYTHIILSIVWAISKTVHRKAFLKTSGAMLVVFGVFNLLYFLNWIPPVPMALKHAGIYHRVDRPQEEYFYRLTFEEPSGMDGYFRTTDRVFNWVPGDTVFCFASVFAPTAMNKKVFHKWEYFDGSNGWILIDQLGYDLFGGRDGGYRGYSMKTAIQPGEWRVEIITEDEVVLGTLDFEVVRAKENHRKFKTIKR